jgi:hypothetical protein
MQTQTWQILAALVLVATVYEPAGSDAQTLSVKPGDTVEMTDGTNRRLTGVVQGLAPSALTVKVDGRDQQWALADMRELWRRGDSLKNGALIGAAAGGAAGLIGGIGLASLFENEVGAGARPLAAMTALGALGGLAAGAGIDALITGRTLVYRAPARSVTMLPLVSSGTRGIRLTVRF